MNTDKELTPEEIYLQEKGFIKNKFGNYVFKELNRDSEVQIYLEEILREYGQQQYEKGRQESIPYTLEEIENMAHDKALGIVGNYDYSAFVDGARWLYELIFKQERNWFPVEERLPENNNPVLGITKKKEQISVIYTKGDEADKICGAMIWMGIITLLI